MKTAAKIVGFLLVGLVAALPCVSCKEEAEQSVSVLLQKAFESARDGDWKTALSYSSKAYRKAPGDSSAMILHALALENQEQEQEALEIIRRAAGADKDSFMAQYTCGRLLFQEGKYEQALIPLKTAFSLKPDDVNTLILLEKCASLCRTRETFDYCQLLWKDPRFKDRFNNGSNPFVMNEMGLYYAIRKNERKALGAFLLAEKIAPEQPEIQLNLAIVYDYMRNERAKAIPHYEKYLRLTASQTGFETERLDVSRRIQEIR